MASASSPPPKGGPTLEWLLSQWEACLDRLGEKNPLVRELLSEVRPVDVREGEVRLAVEGAMSLEGLNHNKAVVGQALANFLGAPTGVTFGPPESDTATPPPGPQRQTLEGDREARMRTYRAQDPALDAVAEALDLELTE